MNGRLPVDGARRDRGACDDCLRRGHLVGRLAGRVARLLDPGSRPVAGLLGLGDEQLVAAVMGARAGEGLSFLEAFDVDAAREELERRGVGATCRHDERYPPALTELGDAPAVLFTRGARDLRDAAATEPVVAIVGTRRPSPYGLEVARELGRGLGAAGVTVVSGLALGIDAAAHRGCLDGRGTTFAVLACGPDVAYPRTNLPLYHEIREHGLVLSELPPGQPPYRWSFPARNRIMAGLARVTVVVEAAEPSGSLITSDFASQLHRAVGAVPGQVTSARAEGSNRLLKDGALVVTCVEDLLDELYGAGSRPAPAPAPAATPPDAVEGLLLEAVEAGMGIDAICTHAGLPVREARAGLSRLEASGRVRRDALGSYRHAAAGAGQARLYD